MDNRFIFLYLCFLVITEGGTVLDSLSDGLKLHRLNGKAGLMSKSVRATLSRAEKSGVKPGNLDDFSIQEKRRQGRKQGPYRKPTQVDRSRRLRRAGELSLRNSANKLDVT